MKRTVALVGSVVIACTTSTAEHLEMIDSLSPDLYVSTAIGSTRDVDQRR